MILVLGYLEVFRGGAGVRPSCQGLPVRQAMGRRCHLRVSTIGESIISVLSWLCFQDGLQAIR